MAEPRTRPPTGEFGEALYDPSTVGYGFEEPLYADSPAVSPDLPEQTPWWETGPTRPTPPTPPSISSDSPSGGGSPGGIDISGRPRPVTGAPTQRHPGLSPAMQGAGAAYPFVRGPSALSLRRAKQEQKREKILAERKRQEAIKEEKRRYEAERQFEKEKLKAMEKLQEKKLALMKLQILKPAWGI